MFFLLDDGAVELDNVNDIEEEDEEDDEKSVISLACLMSLADNGKFLMFLLPGS